MLLAIGILALCIQVPGILALGILVLGIAALGILVLGIVALGTEAGLQMQWGEYRRLIPKFVVLKLA